MTDPPHKTPLRPDSAIVFPDNLTREDIEAILKSAAEQWADEEFERQCKGTSSIKNPVGILSFDFPGGEADSAKAAEEALR